MLKSNNRICVFDIKALVISISILSTIIAYSAVKIKNSSPSVISILEAYIEKNDFNGLYAYITSSQFKDNFAIADCHDKGKIAHNIGRAYYLDSKEMDAVYYFKQAVFEHWKNCKQVNPTEIGNSLFNIAIAYQYTSSIDLGKTYLDSAMILISTIKDYSKEDLFYKFQGAGSYYAELRDFYKAESYFKAAQQISNHVPLIDAYYLHIDLLALYSKFLKYSQANIICGIIESKYLVQTDSFIPIDNAIYHLNKAELNFKTKEYASAEIHVKMALSLLPKEEAYFTSIAHEILGVIYHTTKQHYKSEHHYKLAYSFRLKSEDILQANLAKSFSLENLSEVKMDNSNYSDALSSINEAIALNSVGLIMDDDANPILKKFVLNNSYHLIRQLSLKAKLLFKMNAFNNQDKCLAISYKLDTLINDVLKNAFLDESKIELLSTIEIPTHLFIDISLNKFHSTKDSTFLFKALEFSNKAKANILRSQLAKNEKLTDSQQKYRSEFKAMYEKLNDISSGLLIGTSKKDSLNQSFTETQLKLESLESKYLTDSENSNIGYPDISWKDLQAKLNPGHLLIDVYCSSDSIYIFYLDSKKIECNTLPKDEILPLVNSIKHSLLHPDSLYNFAAAFQIYKALSLDSKLKNKQRLTFIPHDIFHGVPLEALVDETQNFVVKYIAVNYNYHISLLTGNNKIRPFKNEFSGFGTKYSTQLNTHLIDAGYTREESNLAQLFTAERELEVSNQIMGGHLYLGKSANIENFKNTAFHSKILYLSMHSIVDVTNGAHSALLFDDRNKPFVFRAFELLKEPMHTELLILSACHTANGKPIEGEGIHGMTRAFLAAGVRSILASIWSATENSSMSIIPYFLNQCKSIHYKSKALQAAKQEYLSSSSPALRHPYYWANFILISGLEDEIVIDGNNKLYLGLILGLSAILILAALWFGRKKLRIKR